MTLLRLVKDIWKCQRDTTVDGILARFLYGVMSQTKLTSQ